MVRAHGNSIYSTGVCIPVLEAKGDGGREAKLKPYQHLERHPRVREVGMGVLALVSLQCPALGLGIKTVCRRNCSQHLQGPGSRVSRAIRKGADESSLLPIISEQAIVGGFLKVTTQCV